jgi:hypothetical protein
LVWLPFSAQLPPRSSSSAVYFNVAGTAAEPEFVKWALSHVRDASIEHHAKGHPPAVAHIATNGTTAKCRLDELATFRCNAANLDPRTYPLARRGITASKSLITLRD